MRSRRKSLAIAFLVLCVGGLLSWSLFRPQAAPSHPLDQITPEGALLYIEAKDFSTLLRDWNSSAERAQWLKSDDYRVFSNSRLFQRLGRASDQFAAAAGLPPSMQFLVEAAGKESAVAIYDIGNLEFLYITRLSTGNFPQSQLWQSRNKFQLRTAAGKQFYARKDEDSGRVVAFAVADGYLILGTREDLVAGSLELMSGNKGRNLHQEGWFAHAVSAAPDAPGDLRMVMNMERLAVTPHFRTYWIQQNITEMHSYASAVSDLYREGRTYREERVIIPAEQADEGTLAQSGQTVAGLLSSVPQDFGFYRAGVADARQSLAVLQQKILSPQFAAAETRNLSPQVALTGGQAGSASDLETRIDVEPVSGSARPKPAEALLQELNNARVQAMLVVQMARKNTDGVLFNIPSVVAIAAVGDWSTAGLQRAAREIVAPALTTANLGLQWREVKDNGGYYELDGLHAVLMTVRGKVAYFSNDAALLSSVLQTRKPL
ncbi:MAG TPA: hypothetical protein VE133_18040, partial [Candidatus Sulfotelmatobacter sp.]|nr:hypothetical protein [Candidatus Sulfotelmatobacter sp.]